MWHRLQYFIWRSWSCGTPAFCFKFDGFLTEILVCISSRCRNEPFALWFLRTNTRTWHLTFIIHLNHVWSVGVGMRLAAFTAERLKLHVWKEMRGIINCISCRKLSALSDRQHAAGWHRDYRGRPPAAPAVQHVRPVLVQFPWRCGLRGWCDSAVGQRAACSQRTVHLKRSFSKYLHLQLCYCRCNLQGFLTLKLFKLLGINNWTTCTAW